MQSNTDARLTLPYLRKLERENYLALATVVLLSAAGLFLMPTSLKFCSILV
jgi:hypothetical protein